MNSILGRDDLFAKACTDTFAIIGRAMQSFTNLSEAGLEKKVPSNFLAPAMAGSRLDLPLAQPSGMTRWPWIQRSVKFTG